MDGMHWSFTTAECREYMAEYRLITDKYRDPINGFNPLDERIRAHMAAVTARILAAR